MTCVDSRGMTVSHRHPPDRATLAIEVDGAAIRARRTSRGVTITELAHACGVSRSYVSKIERGHRDRVNPPVLAALAEQLDVPARKIRK